MYVDNRLGRLGTSICKKNEKIKNHALQGNLSNFFYSFQKNLAATQKSICIFFSSHLAVCLSLFINTNIILRGEFSVNVILIH